MNTISIRESLLAAKNESASLRGISGMAQKLIASEILKVAGEIRQRVRAGADILDLTVGDFSSKEFPIPDSFRENVKRAIDEGHTNYPPSSGVIECREAVRELFKSRLGLDYPIESVLIAGGARPMIAGTYFAIVNPGDRVVYPLPSWNNNHYCTLTGAERVEVTTTRKTGFFPTIAEIEPHLETARLVCLNTPLNPTGTVMEKAELQRLSEAIVNENRRRKQRNVPALYLMFDQVYWMLTFHGATHNTPVNLVPEIAPYVIFVDGISKSFAATGMRVGWALGPIDVIERMGAILTHMGAWAPKPEQIATARLLQDQAAIEQYLSFMHREVSARLDLLAEGIRALKADGHEVDAIDPQGAIYLSLKLQISGKKTPEGKTLSGDEDIRSYLLNSAGVAVVPFQAFGLRDDSGWFRASVGAVSKEDIERGIARMRTALSKLK